MPCLTFALFSSTPFDHGCNVFRQKLDADFRNRLQETQIHGQEFGGRRGLSSSCWPGHSNVGIPLDDQWPIFGGEELKGGRMLAECNVKEESTLHLKCLRRSGGDGGDRNVKARVGGGMDDGHRPIHCISSNPTGMTATGPAWRPPWMSGRAREYGFGLAICRICGDPDFHYMRNEQGTICTTACAGCSLANGLGDLMAHWPLEPREI